MGNCFGSNRERRRKSSLRAEVRGPAKNHLAPRLYSPPAKQHEKPCEGKESKPYKPTESSEGPKGDLNERVKDFIIMQRKKMSDDDEKEEEVKSQDAEQSTN